MSNKTRLQTNNNNLQSILDTVNSLPSGGSSGGSSSGNVETCTVTVDFGSTDNSILCLRYVNNKYEQYRDDSKTSYTIENVPVNSNIFIFHNNLTKKSDITTTGDIISFFPTVAYGGMANLYMSLITGTAEATITYNYGGGW